MAAIKAYFISVTAVAAICAIVITLFEKKGAISGQIKLLAGIILTIAVIRPLIHIRIQNVTEYTDEVFFQADVAVSAGEAMAEREMESIIKARLQTYILDKATALGAELEVEVFVQECVPVGAMLCGAVSPYVKIQLENWMADSVGIPKEAQQWTG